MTSMRAVLGFLQWLNIEYDFIRDFYLVVVVAYSGPLRDHTTGLTGGGYLHAPSVKGNVTKGHRAILLSPPQKPAEKNEACWMRFYYHMFGEDMGSLNVTTETYRTSSKPPSVSVKQIFYIEGNHGDHWIRQSVPLESEEPFRVAFIATVGGIRSDIVSSSNYCFFERNTYCRVTEWFIHSIKLLAGFGWCFFQQSLSTLRGNFSSCEFIINVSGHQNQSVYGETTEDYDYPRSPSRRIF